MYRLPSFHLKPARRRLLALAAVTPLLAGCTAQALVNAVTPRGHYDRHDDIAYGPAPRQQLDVYVPTAGRGQLPVVVFFYGGAWQRGNRGFYAFVGEALAAQGFVAVIADYRVWPEAGFPAFVDDAALAVAWTARRIAEHGGDPGRIVVAGHSAGAHIAALLALDARYLARQPGTPRLRGMVGMSGPYDFLPLTSPRLAALFGPEAGLADTQPVNFARPDAPPLLLQHGADDRTVRPENSEELAQRIQRAGGEAELKVYPGYGHAEVLARVAAPLRDGAPVLPDLASFVRRVTASPPA